MPLRSLPDSGPKKQYMAIVRNCQERRVLWHVQVTGKVGKSSVDSITRTISLRSAPVNVTLNTSYVHSLKPESLAMLDDRITDLERELRAAPGNLEIIVRLAGLLQRAGRDRESAVHWIRFLQRQPSDASATRSLLQLADSAADNQPDARRILETRTVWRPADGLVIVSAQAGSSHNGFVGIMALFFLVLAFLYLANGGWMYAAGAILGAAAFVTSVFRHTASRGALIVDTNRQQALLLASRPIFAASRASGRVEYSPPQWRQVRATRRAAR